MSLIDQMDKPALIEYLQNRITNFFPGHLGIEIVDVGSGFLAAQLSVQPFHMAPNGYLHAGSVITLADTSSGSGCSCHLPDEAKNFTTLELKSNFLRTTNSGIVHCMAKMAHGGRRTQIWDATVTDDQGRTMALFRCTQMILY
ncbi:MAG: PaaI family thioesterase [Chloroflexota bacterium]